MIHPPMPPIGFGIIGAGDITRYVTPALKNSPLLHPVAVADNNLDAAQRAATDLEAPRVFSDYTELLKCEEVQAVYVATPPFLHAEMVTAALEAGKHVICEKPFGRTAEEVRRLLEVSQRFPELKVSVCSSRFFCSPPFQKAQELIGQGWIGLPQRVRFSHTSKIAAQWPNGPAWRHSKEASGGGQLADWGVYDLDWLRVMLGQYFDPVSILGTLDFTGGGLEAGYSAEILCRSGLTISLERWMEHGPVTERLQIRGSEGGLDLPMMVSEPPAPLTGYRFDNEGNLKTETLSAPLADWGPVLAYPIIDLAEAIVNDRQPVSPPEAQLLIHTVIDAIYESAATSKPVEVKS